MTVPLGDLARQKALWATIPDAGCKGLCVDACGPIGMTDLEAAVLVGTGRVRPDELEPFGEGRVLLVGDDGVCPLLEDGRCSVYQLRPAICRGFGSVDDPLLRCPHGCEPAGGPMATAAFRAVLNGQHNRR